MSGDMAAEGKKNLALPYCSVTPRKLTLTLTLLLNFNATTTAKPITVLQPPGLCLGLSE